MNNVSVNLHIFSLTNMSDSQKKKKWLIDLGVECVKLISFSILHQFKQMLLEKLIFWLTSMPNRPLVVLSIVKGYSYPLFLAPLWEHMWEMSSYLSISFDYIDSIIKWRKRKNGWQKLDMLCIIKIGFY